jgi:Protein of unknown function (DUF2589)
MDEQSQPLLSIAQQFTGLPIDTLIAGPLMAAVSANNAMAQSQVNFMLSTCFNKGSDTTSDTQLWEPIMIQMNLTRNLISSATASDSTPSVSNITTTIELPILTIIPLNSLAVDDVSVEFTMQVKSATSSDTSQTTASTTSGTASGTGSIGWGPFSLSMTASISYSSSSNSTASTHYEASNSASYDVKVHAGQLPLPLGVGLIIQAYAANITPIMLPKSSTS